MTEYSFYNCIKYKYRNITTKQSIRSNYQLVRKDATCVANAEIKYSYLALPMEKNTIKNDLSNTVRGICQIRHLKELEKMTIKEK